MPRSRFFETRLTEAETLRVLREFIEWLQTRYPSAEVRRIAFWKWWRWLTPEQISSRASATFDLLMQKSRAWKWEQHRGEWLYVLECVEEGKSVALPHLQYGLHLAARAGGHKYYEVTRLYPRDLTEDDFAELVLDEVLRLLDRLRADVLGRCLICKRVFLRLRAGARMYCSHSCRQKGALEAGRTRRPSRKMRPVKGGVVRGRR